MDSELLQALHRIIQEAEARAYNRGLKYKKQVEYWQGKFKTVKHENNMLRKKFREFQYEKLMQDLMNDPELVEAFQRRQPKGASDDK